MPRIQLTKVLITTALFVLISARLWSQFPEGFDYTLVTSDIPQSANIDFANNDKLYVADFNGRVWLMDNGTLLENPILDLSEEVAGFGEVGCLGFALHPDFELNGYFYLLYVVDRHHLLYHGTDLYDPEANEYGDASMGRLVRYQVQLSDYSTIVPGSRTVLLGAEIGTGNPALTASHGTGDLIFGSDGTLLCSLGDGNTWANYYAGGEQETPPYCFEPQGLIDGIISPEENVGAFRAQQLESYSGKVIRIDPETGEGVPSNPFFDPQNPDAARSKVWAFGLRNPYRLTLRPGTGSDSPDDGNPGTLYISDVGFNQWEEINIADGPGYNFGWPLYEGMSENPGYINTFRENQFQPNPLVTNCEQEFFTFQQLIQQENQDHDYSFPNPCDPASDIGTYADVFVHTRPALAYKNQATFEGDIPVVPGFDDSGAAVALPFNAPEQGVENASVFNGIAAMVGDFYEGTTFPEEYHNMLPVLDYAGWLKPFWFNQNHELIKMDHWLSGLVNVIDIRYNPFDECYYTVGLFPAQIKKICYVGNRAPVIGVSADPSYGTSPLLVNFDASESYDPDGDPLSFEWEFGDGSAPSSEINPSHVYNAPGIDPYSYTATLTVSDTAGNSTSEDLLISLNNSPPEVYITSIEENQLYSMSGPSSFDLIADVWDNEHPNSELNYHWESFFHHNTHFHPLNATTEQTSVLNVLPVGCGIIDTYHYRVRLTVTDPEGLQGQHEISLFPDCDSLFSTLSSDWPSNEIPIVVYPNPSYDGVFRVDMGPLKKDQNTVVRVTDTSGREVWTKSILISQETPEFSFSADDWAPGIYFLQISGQEFSGSARLVKLAMQ